MSDITVEVRRSGWDGLIDDIAALQAELSALRADRDRLRDVLEESQAYLEVRIRGNGGIGESIVLPRIIEALRLSKELS